MKNFARRLINCFAAGAAFGMSDGAMPLRDRVLLGLAVFVAMTLDDIASDLHRAHG